MGNMIYQEVAFASQWVFGGFLGWGGGGGWSPWVGTFCPGASGGVGAQPVRSREVVEYLRQPEAERLLRSPCLGSSNTRGCPRLNRRRDCPLDGFSI